MWLNQDKMFADKNDELTEGDERAIRILDDLACSIADGDVSVDKISLQNEMAEAPKRTDGGYPVIEQYVVGKTLTIRYNN